MVGGTNFYDRREIKDVLCYLKTIDNGRDDLAVRRIINVPKRGIGATTVTRAADYAAFSGKSLFEVMERGDQIPDIKKAGLKLRAFAEMIHECRQYALTHSLVELGRFVLETTGYIEALRASGEEDAEDRENNVQELMSKLADFEQRMSDEDQEATLTGFLEDVALVADIDDVQEGDNRVLLMTLHSAKGLEFPHVYLTGMEENIFPSYQSVQDYTGEAIEEERRLAYVGITRAMQDLTLTRAQCRMIRGEVHFNPVSRFAAEIPEDLVDDDTVRRTRRNYSFDLDLEADSGEIPFGSPSAGRSRSGGSYSAGSSFGGKEAGGKPASAVSASDRAGGISASVRKRPKAVYSGRHTAEDKKPFIARTSAGKTAVPGSLRKGMPAPAEPDYGVGDRVSHIKYGSGTVSALEKTPRDYKVTVQFEEYGQKVMYAGFAKLKKI